MRGIVGRCRQSLAAWPGRLRPTDPIERHFRPIVRREIRKLRQARRRRGGDYAGAGDAPLVSVVLPTRNRAQLLMERAVASVLQQTYTNFELIVVLDNCTDDSLARLQAIDDPRVRWHELVGPRPAPEDPVDQHRVMQSAPTNEGYRLARGTWIAPIDDDDVWTPDHIEVLLRHAQRENLEFVYGKMRREARPGEWVVRGDPDFAKGRSNPPASLFRTYLRLFPNDADAWRVGMAHDRHRHLRMAFAGVRGGFLDQIVAHSPLRPGQREIGFDPEGYRAATGPQSTQSNVGEPDPH